IDFDARGVVAGDGLVLLSVVGMKLHGVARSWWSWRRPIVTGSRGCLNGAVSAEWYFFRTATEHAHIRGNFETDRQIQQARRRLLRNSWSGPGQGAPDGRRRPEDHQAQYRQPRRVRFRRAGRDRQRHDPQYAWRGRLH